jgi:hypothetical protein
MGKGNPSVEVKDVFGEGAQKDSERLIRCTLASMGLGTAEGKRLGGSSAMLLRLYIEASLLVSEDVALRSTCGRTAEVEREERELKVDELGVEGLMSEGTCPDLGGDEDRRFMWF